MLVLRRRAGEGFSVGDGIQVEVLEVSASRVKLGIVAPPEVPITRKEVLLTRSENLSAARQTSPEAIARLMRKLSDGRAVSKK